MGWSMGAVTSILAGAEADEVKAVIADSPFANLNEYAQDSFQYWTGLPKSFAAGTTRAIGVIVPGFNPGEVMPLNAAQAYPSDKGLFLIHSIKDGAIPYSESEASIVKLLEARFGYRKRAVIFAATFTFKMSMKTVSLIFCKDSSENTIHFCQTRSIIHKTV